MSSILDINNLSVSFSSTEVVHDISLSVPRGKTLALVGESGSGKTVTALSVMRLLSGSGKITGGEILFRDGESPVNLLMLPEKKMRSLRGNRMAMVFQEPMTALNPVFSCGAQVAEAIRTHRDISRAEAREETLALFERVRLADPQRMFASYPHQLSGGQKQRILVAMAICCRPDLLIADEPTSSLDMTAQSATLEILSRLQEETGMSMLFISHDLSLVAGFAQEMAVMYQGRIVESGSVDQLFTGAQHPYTNGLLSCRPPLDFRCHTLPVLSDFLREGADGSLESTGKDPVLLLNSYRVNEQDRSNRLQKLYSQEPVLRVQEMAAWLPVESGVIFSGKEVVKAVDGVSFDVRPGETLGIAGESGSGKTTLARCIPRLTEPTAGRIFFEGTDVLNLEGWDLQSYRRQVQIVFQDPYASLNPAMKIGEAILEPMVYHKLYKRKEARDRVMELLHRVGLEEKHYSRTPDAFSGGQRQRIVLARALATQPKVLLCDEAVSALDASIQAQVLNLINRLKKDFDLTCIFITHDLSIAKFMSDRLAVMKDGRFVEMGDADEVCRSPKSEYTRQLLAAVPQGLAARA